MANLSLHLSIYEEFKVQKWELAWCSLILVTGALGNLLVCLVICKSSSGFRSTPFNMFLCSLAVTDMLLALVVLPNYVLSTSIFNHPDGLWGDVMCKTITGDFLTFYFSNVSGYTLVLITLERLRAAQKFPETISNDANKGCRWRAWLSIVIAWLIPLALDGPGAFYILNYKHEKTPVVGNHCIYIWEGEPTLKARIYGAAILIFEGLIPLMIFIYSFYHIRKFLVEEEKRMSRRTGNEFNEGYRYYSSWQRLKRIQKTVKVFMITSAVYVVCWIPNKIMFFMVTYVGQGEKYSKFTLNSDVYQIGILLGFTGSCINPYLYAWQSKEFRKHCKKTLKSLLPKCLNCDFQYRQVGSTNQENSSSNISALRATTENQPECERDSTAFGSAIELSTSDSTPSTSDSTPILNAALHINYETRNQPPAAYGTII